VGYELQTALHRFYVGHNAYPLPADIAHLAWQRLAEFREYENWLLAAEKKDLEDVPWVAEAEPGDVVTPPVPLPPERILEPRSDFLGRWDRPLFMWGGMTPAEREEQLEWMAGHGYVTVPLAIHNDYPRFPHWQWDWWDRPDLLRAALRDLHADGCVPWLVCHPKPGWSISEHLSRLASLWPEVADLVPAVTWGWEINDLGSEWANGSRQLDYLSVLHSLTSVPIWVHFTPERWSGWPGFDGQEQDRDEVAWLKEAGARGVVGLAYQAPYDQEESAALERMLTIPSPHGWSPGICGRVTEGAGLRFVAFEFARDEARHQRMVSTLSQDARVSGWC
jgi:hypothetical protein